jgi:hypothetical protein
MVKNLGQHCPFFILYDLTSGLLFQKSKSIAATFFFNTLSNSYVAKISAFLYLQSSSLKLAYETK